MPGYVIHLAIGKVYQRNNNIKDIESFEKGIIAPDLAKSKAMSHYGPYSSNPGLSKYLKEHGINNEYDEGYFLHLASDYLFYSKFLNSWSDKIYEDYNILNNEIVDKYGITIPKEIEYIIQPKEGKLNILNREDVHKFIETVGKINYRELVKKYNKTYDKDIKKLDYEIE